MRLLEDGRTACLAWNAPQAAAAVTAYQVRVDLQEGKKRRLEEGFEYRYQALTY